MPPVWTNPIGHDKGHARPLSPRTNWDTLCTPKNRYNVFMKQCRYCDKFYPEDAFGVAKTMPNKVFRRRKCRHCYRDTKQALINKCLTWLNEYKKLHGCQRCKISDPRVLDFHHKKGEDKLFTIASFRRAVSFDRVKAEVLKCEIVCANCHRILHDELRRQKREENGA